MNLIAWLGWGALSLTGLSYLAWMKNWKKS